MILSQDVFGTLYLILKLDLVCIMLAYIQIYLIKFILVGSIM